MTEIRIAPDGETVAQRHPMDRDDGRNWFSWVFENDMVNVAFRSEDEVADWQVIWPTDGVDHA